MKRVIAYFVSGMRTGSFFYLCLVLLSHVYTNIVYPAVNVRNILAIFLMSGTMGVLTFILEEEEFLTYSLRVVLHLVVTATILALTYLFFWLGGSLTESDSLVDLSSHLRPDLAVPDLATP